MMKVSKLNQTLIEYNERALKCYPSAEAIRKLAVTKKEKKADTQVNEKKGSKSKDKKKEAKGEVSE